MTKSKMTLVIIMICGFLLNSTMLLAAVPNDHDAISIQKVLNNKDKVIEEKFQSAKKWFRELKPSASFSQFFTNSLKQFRSSVSNIYSEILTKINGISERHYSKV